MIWRRTLPAAAALTIGTIVAGGRPLRAAWQPRANAALEQASTPASANVLSEHEIEALDAMPPQAQAELLLERSINHYGGASSQIAGIEVDIAARSLRRDGSTVDRLEPIARWGDQGPRVNAMWDLALIGNRGVEPERVLEIIRASIRDDNQSIRYWAVEGLAYLAVDAAIPPLLETFHDDPSPAIRERAACGLAQSGMFTAAQRRTAVPALIGFAEDGSVQGDTREWIFQALRDITGQTLPHDPVRWRDWYNAAQKK